MIKSIKHLTKTTFLLLVFCFLLTACGNKCEHTYDNACDATCNDCGETREVSAHQWEDATCITAKTCKTCGTTEGEPLGHKPAEDDGDCTTEVKCTVCGNVTTPAGQHTPNDDDGDCTTAITCTVCGTVTTPAKENHTGGTATCLGYQCDVCGKWYGDKTSDNHASEEFAYTVNEDVYTHRKAHKCCDVTVIEAEAHDFVFETGKCKHCDAQAVAELFDYFNSTNVGYYFTMADAFEAIPDDDNLYAVCALADYDADFTIPDNLFTFFGASDRAPAGYTNYVVHSFGGTVINESMISDGIFNGKVINQSDIIGGTDCIFNCEVINEGTIQGGTFNGEVTNTGTIIIGIFNGCIINNGRIRNDRYNGALTLGENFSIVNNGTIDCKYHIYKDGVCRLCAYECDHSGTAHTTAIDNGDGTHGFTCTVCGGNGTESHKGGTATCVAQAVCTICGNGYGDLAPNNHTSTEFTYTENNDGTHNKLYACCEAVHTESEACSIGNATCTEMVLCEFCNYHYGNIDENAHAYAATVYTWSPDYSACTATIICAYNAEHAITETAEVQHDTTNNQLFATFANTAFEEARIAYPYTFSEVSGGYSITDYTGTNEILHIPSTYNGSPIVSIGTQAFRDCDTLVEIIIPEGITTIGDTCFYVLDNLKKVYIPASVTTIDRQGFAMCTALTDVVFAENSNLTTLGDMAFNRCESLVSISLPQSVVNFGSSIFGNCSALENVVLPESITAVPNSIFYRCTSLKEFSIPVNVTSIGSSAFYYCTNLTVVGSISNVTSIGNSAFSYCSSLKEINLPNCLTSIGEEAFTGCKSLTSIQLPEGITEIKKSTFSYCDNLTEFTIPSTVTSIGNWAFQYCNGLTTITIPKGVTDVGFCAFHMCDNLISINVEEGNERYWSVDGILYGNDSGMVALLQCPNGKAGVVTVQEGTQRIDHFMYCEKITAVIIPDSVTWIQKEAFYGCTFESITIPKSLETLGLRSLGQNENLKTVYYGGTTEEWNTLIAKVSTVGISESVVVICSDSEIIAE